MDEPQDEEQVNRPRSGLRRSSRASWIVLAFVVVVGVAALFEWRRQRAASPLSAPQPTAAAPSPSAATAGPAPAVSPGRAQSLLESVSPNALYRRGLAEGDTVHRWAVVTDNLAEGVSPRAQLGFLAPAAPFSVADRGGKGAIAPASYQRYDGFADAVASVDAQALAKAYREIHPVLETAYRALGYPDASLDRVAARALQRIEAAPVRDGDVVVERQGDVYVFADPGLEGQGPVEKHLLRMGPRNTRLLQGKAREILRALGFHEGPVAGGQER